MNWNKVCNEVTCGGIIKIINDKEETIISSPQICKTLKQLYKEHPDYEYLILEEVRNIFGKKLETKLKELESKYKDIPLEQLETKPETKPETNPDWWQAKKDGHIIISIDKEHLENTIKNTLKDDINTYIICSYNEK